MTSAEAYEAYEASDEASESELLDKSLSVWRSLWLVDREDFDIHTASSIGHYEYVRSLILRGDVEIDKKNRGSWTPLMYACYIGHDNIVNLLLEAECNINVKNHKGQTPLMLAASCGNETVGRTLCRNGAELEEADRKGWTALFHATYAGHQNFVHFLLEEGANMNAVEPTSGKTPFLEAAAEGHEIIVQLFLHHGVEVNARAFNGDMARSLALINGHMKVVSLIDNHVMPLATLRSEPDLGGDLSSSDEAYQQPRHHLNTRNSKNKVKDPSIMDGPKAIARLIDRGPSKQNPYPNSCVPKGYVTFPHTDVPQSEETRLSYRDVTSPINPEDYTLDSSGGRESCDYEDDGNAFSKTGAITIKSSSSSSGGLVAALGLSRESSSDSDDRSFDRMSKSCDPISTRKKPSSELSASERKSQTWSTDRRSKLPLESQLNDIQISSDTSSPSVSPAFSRQSDSDSAPSPLPASSVFKDCDTDSAVVLTEPKEAEVVQLPGVPNEQAPIPFDYLPALQSPDTPACLRRPFIPESACILPGDPQDLSTLLSQLGLQKYLSVFDEQDVDLQVFLSLTDNDLKEIGIKLFGPRKKMTNAIARWHSRAPLSASSLEQCYADRLEGEMQEMGIQLNQAYASVEKLKAQVLQEHQLRSVTEGCLMEEKNRVHHLSVDSSRKCAEVKDTLKKLKHYHCEIKERLNSYLNSVSDQSNESTHSRPTDLKQGFSLDDWQPRQANDVKALSLEILMKKIDHYVKDIQHAVTLVTVNCEHLMDKSVKESTIDQGLGSI